MTRTTILSTLWCTALVASLAAYGCGSSSTIDTGTGGRSGGTAGSPGSGGSGIIIVGGMGGARAGTAGAPGNVDAGGPPADAGAPVCMAGATCTAGFTCTATCTANMGRGPGTRACTCGGNNQVNCMACVPIDAGAPPPPVDAGPAVDAGPICANGVFNNRPCVVGTNAPCTRNPNGANPQACTCVAVPDAGADAAVGATWMCQ